MSFLVTAGTVSLETALTGTDWWSQLASNLERAVSVKSLRWF